MGREENPVDALSQLFPKERGGMPAHLLKAARNAAYQILQKLDIWEDKVEKYMEKIRKARHTHTHTHTHTHIHAHTHTH